VTPIKKLAPLKRVLSASVGKPSFTNTKSNPNSTNPVIILEKSYELAPFIYIPFSRPSPIKRPHPTERSLPTVQRLLAKLGYNQSLRSTKLTSPALSKISDASELSVYIKGNDYEVF
jgi:hypothetical protein